MAGEAPWIVGTLVAIFIAVVAPAGVLVSRVQRKTATADRKLSELELSITSWRDLVQDLQEERDTLKREKAEWRTERITMQHDIADLRKEKAALQRKLKKAGIE